MAVLSYDAAPQLVSALSALVGIVKNRVVGILTKYHKDKKLFSYDVTVISITSLPVDKALLGITAKLQGDDTRSALSVGLQRLSELLDFSLRPTYAKYDCCLYPQCCYVILSVSYCG